MPLAGVCVFRLITVRCLVSGAHVIICISSNFSRGNQNSAGATVLRAAPQKVAFFGLFFYFILFIFLGACAPTMCGNQKSRAVQRLCKERARRRSGRQLRGQHAGVDGVLLRQVPNSTSARGVLCSIHLYLPLRGAFAANPPTSITLLIS